MIPAVPEVVLVGEADPHRRYPVDYVEAARAPNTKKAYRTDWAEFSAWAGQRGLATMPAASGTVALYLTDLAAVAKSSTVERRLASVAFAHRTAGQPSPTDDPTVKAVWAGIRRVHGTAEDQATPGGTRDAALLLVGFAGALRRSELVALDVADLEHRHEGLVVTLRRSKTDQEAAGSQVGIPYGSNPATCPVRNLRAWRDIAAINDGPLFRPVDRHGRIAGNRLSAAGANRIVQRAVGRTGTDPHSYSAHSLRAGLATAAAEAGSPNGPS